MAKDKHDNAYDRYLGMDRPITRRDFLNGMAIAVGTSLIPTNVFGANETAEAQDRPGYYPPNLTKCAAAVPDLLKSHTACATGLSGRQQEK
jgi:hypothetical protein